MAEERYYSLNAVILRTRDYKESDKLVHLFSLERGRRTALARGARKPTGGLRGLVQPFTHVNLTFAKGRGFDIITQGEVERPFISLRQDLAKIAYASYMTELVDASLPENKVNREAFLLLLTAFSLLDLDAEPKLAARFFELRLLVALGLRPSLDGCQSCGRGLPGARFQLSPERGGLVCASCARLSATEMLLSPGAVRTMQHLLEAEPRRLPRLKISAAGHAEIAHALAHYLDYFFERTSQARGVLRRILED